MNETELGARAFWMVSGLGFLGGFGSWWAFLRWSDREALRRAANRVVAHLFEIRLFSDEPALVMRAQRDLIAANGRFLREMARPSLLLLLPMLIVVLGMDAFFGRAPLQPGKPSVVTLRYRPSPGGQIREAYLRTPDGMQVETPAVHVPRFSEVSWRVRAFRAVAGNLAIHWDGRALTKSISSGTGLQWLSPLRVSSPARLLLHPFELPFPDGAAESISVEYPRATIFRFSWTVWFSVALFPGALALPLLRRLRRS